MVPQNIQEQFYMKYPDAKSVQWSSQNGYSVASFYHTEDGTQSKCSAWFSLADGFWDLTEYEIPYASLPDTVRTVFEQTEYAASPWVVDREVDVLERDGIETLFVVSVENPTTSTEMDLYFSADGILLKEVIDDKPGGSHAEDYLPQTPATTIDQWIDQKYPGARIIDVELENGGTEIELVYRGAVYEILFNSAQEWLYTKRELPRREYATLPPAVLSALKVEFPDVAESVLTLVDDVDYYQTSDNGNFYCIEVETRFDDQKVYISDEGLVIEKPALGGGSGQGGVPVDTEIGTWIAGKYVGAIIVGREYDDGFLEIDFMHENVKKTAYFNGAGQWVYTEWEMRYAALPEAVRNTIQNQYKNEGYHIEDDEIEVVERGTGVTYEIEVEKWDVEKKIVIGADGTVVSERYD